MLPDPQDVLNLKLPENDSGQDTVRGYLMMLLSEVWRYGEGFSGKRPFGNSGWKYDLFIPLIKAGYIDGELDDDGWPKDFDDATGSLIILQAIQEMGNARA